MNPVATSDAAFRGGACPTPEYTIAYTGNYTTSADANTMIAAIAAPELAIVAAQIAAAMAGLTQDIGISFSKVPYPR